MPAKRAAKRAVRKVAKKAVKRVARKAVTGTWITPKKPMTVPSGYGTDPKSGLVIPVATQAPIKPTKLKKGLQDARRIIDSTIAEIMAPSDQYDIQSIELTLTFGVKGEFLGFGGSGGTSVKVRIGPPSKAEGN